VKRQLSSNVAINSRAAAQQAKKKCGIGLHQSLDRMVTRGSNAEMACRR
jgi:hypothetical protein